MTRMLISTLVAFLIFGPGAWADAAKKPNVLIVMTDDQGLGDFSFTGNPVLKTPNFDAFARQAIRLTDFHVAPMCSPTRGQLLTGLAALRNGATSVTAGRTFLRPGIPTLADIFSQAGYRTGIFGKWHLGDFYPHRPMDKGFQESIYHLGWGLLQSTPEFDWPLIDGRYFHNGAQKRYQGHCTDLWFDSAMTWIKKCKQQDVPFLLLPADECPSRALHRARRSMYSHIEGRGPAGFFGMIAHVDKRFGDLTKFLSEEKLEDDTIVVFMTDNGGTAGVKTHNAGLRAGKTTYYEGGHRVPCWIRWPDGKLGAPRDISTPTQNTDLLPTLCDLCGVAPPARDPRDAPYSGVSLASVLRGSQPLLDRMFVVQYGQELTKFDACVVGGKWRLIKGQELYDVEADRAQQSDIAAQHPGVVATLRDYYERWWRGRSQPKSEFVPISIGARQQRVVELTSGDWEGIYADNSGYVREAAGGPTGGHWNIQVEEAGEYSFTLRRWPERAQAALGEKYEVSPRSPANKPNLKTVGFPTIAAARIDISGVAVSATADPKATSVTVTANLPAGRTKLKAWFVDSDGHGLCGAFFVTVARP